MTRLIRIGVIFAPIPLLLGLYRFSVGAVDHAYFIGSFVVVALSTLYLVVNKRKALKELEHLRNNSREVATEDEP